jgi:hypothetical protein
MLDSASTLFNLAPSCELCNRRGYVLLAGEENFHFRLSNVEPGPQALKKQLEFRPGTGPLLPLTIKI